MKDFSWMFKRHLKPLVVFIAAEAVVIGGIFYSFSQGEPVRIGIAFAAFAVAQYVIYTAWRDIRDGDEWDDDGPKNHGNLTDF